MPLTRRGSPHAARTLAAFVATAGAVGCGPIASFRPASGLMSDRSLEVGAGAAMVTARPYVNESAAGAGQIWVTGELDERTAISAITAFDTDALGAGGALRVNAIQSDRFRGGIEGEAGYAWAAIGLPVAIRVFDQSWLYTAPRLGNWSFDLSFGVPIGASVRIIDGWMLRAEWQRSWQDFKYYNRRDHYGLATAYQF